MASVRPEDAKEEHDENVWWLFTLDELSVEEWRELTLGLTSWDE